MLQLSFARVTVHDKICIYPLIQLLVEKMSFNNNSICF